MSALIHQIRSGTSADYVLFLLHGLGSDERDMLGLAAEFDPRFTVICPRAPKSYGPGFAWFDVEWTDAGIHVDEESAVASLTALADWLRSQPRKKTTLVGGFSQGAMMSSGIWHNHPDLLDGAVLLSGRSLPYFLRNPHPNPDLMSPVFIAHGSFDPVISIEQGAELRDILHEEYHDIEWHEYPMQHSVCWEEITALNAWLKRF